jgi:uncharacterized glyoxalase superfamily protein PhnB
MIAPILNVTDLDASVNFYTQKLGFKHDFSLPGPDGKNAFAFVSMGEGVAIGLSKDPVASKHRGEGVDLMIYIPDEVDIDTFYKDVNAKGITPETELKTQYWGDRTFSLHDPDGFRLTIAHTVEQPNMEDMAAIMRGDQTAE